MRRIKTSAVIAAAFLGIVVGSASAAEIVVAKVPFPFAVHGHEFAAGRYQVDIDAGVLTVRGIDNHAAVVALTVPEGGRDPVGDRPALVFTHDEHQYQLSQVWESKYEGREVLKRSDAPRRASAAADRPMVVVAASSK